METVKITSDGVAAAVADLKSFRNELAASDSGFAASLINQFEKRGALSEKQMYWVGVLLARAVAGPSAAASPDAPNPKLEDASGLFTFFANAGKKLKWPKLSFNLDEVGEFRLQVAGFKAKFPGSINMTDGKPYGMNKWFGRIALDGTIEFSGRALPNERIVIERLVRSFSKDPKGTAAKYGLKTGNCCFCNKKLEDEVSTAVGYGPVCAKKWGLDHNHVAAVKAGV